MNNSEQIPRLRNYVSAVAHHDKMRAYARGAHIGKKPLGENRRYTRALIQVNAETQDVECTLYGHKVVVYKPNDEIHISLCGFNTPSTREFAYILCGAQVFNKLGSPYIQFNDKVSPIENSKHTMILKDGTIVNAVNDKSYRLNHKAFGEIKKRYTKLREYIAMMSKVVEEVSAEEVESDSDAIRSMAFFDKFTSSKERYTLAMKSMVVGLKPRVEAMVESEDLDEFYHCFKIMAALALPLNFKKEVFYNQGGVFAGDIVKMFDEYLKVVYAKEIFNYEELPPNKLNGNGNKQYIRAHNLYFN